MAEAGLFADERVELLDGEIITMSPKLTLHTFTVNRLMYALIAQLGTVALVRVQDPIVLNNWSEPEPDIAVCQPDPDNYKQAQCPNTGSSTWLTGRLRFSLILMW
jgi:Uma2 family endonuclease